MAPVDVRDVAAAVKEVLLREETAGQTFSLQGPDTYTWEQIVRLVLNVIREKRLALYMPHQLGVLAAKPREFLQTLVPFPVPMIPGPLYTSDNVLGASVDYVAAPGALGARGSACLCGCLGWELGESDCGVMGGCSGRF